MAGDLKASHAMNRKPGNEHYYIHKGWLTESWQVMHSLIWSFKVQEIGRGGVMLLIRGMIHPRLTVQYQITLETTIVEQTESMENGVILVKMKLMRGSIEQLKSHIAYLVEFPSGLKKSYQYAFMIKL